MKTQKPIDRLCDEIIRLCSPSKILLFSQKQRPSGDICSVKLCVIIPDGDSHQIEHLLYVNVDSEFPFDVLVYTEKEWDDLLKSRMSFANRIQKSGRVLYAAD